MKSQRPTPPPTSDHHPTVLIVEDEALIRMSTADYLLHCGYRVIEANNADEAVAILTEAHADVVFTDVNMPGSRDGVGLAQWVHRERPQVKVIVTSGVVRASEEADKDGPLLQKPYANEELEERIRRLLASR
jgi:CheY-like chemotaxis protein